MTDTSPINSILSIPLGTVLLLVLIFVFAGLIVLAGVVVHFGTRLRYLATPVYDHIVKEAEEKAQKIVTDAQGEARVMVENARAEAEKAFSDRSKRDEEMRQEQAKHIEELTQKAQELLNKQTLTITQLSETMATDFSKQAHAAQKELEGEMTEMKKAIGEETERVKKTFGSLAVKADQDYKELVVQTRNKLEEGLENEVKVARDAVKAYRIERIALLNKEIVGLVEDTARLALHKSLSLGQHRDIIITSLEEAKQAGIFAKNV